VTWPRLSRRCDRREVGSRQRHRNWLAVQTTPDGARTVFSAPAACAAADVPRRGWRGRRRGAGPQPTSGWWPRWWCCCLQSWPAGWASFEHANVPRRWLPLAGLAVQVWALAGAWICIGWITQKSGRQGWGLGLSYALCQIEGGMWSRPAGPACLGSTALLTGNARRLCELRTVVGTGPVGSWPATSACQRCRLPCRARPGLPEQRRQCGLLRQSASSGSRRDRHAEASVGSAFEGREDCDAMLCEAPRMCWCSA